MSFKSWRLRVLRRQISGPIDLFAIGKSHFRWQRLPSVPILLADGDVESDGAVRLLIFAPLVERGFKIVCQRFGRMQAQDPVVRGILHVGSAINAIHTGNHFSSVFARDFDGIVRRTVVHDNDLIAWAKRIESASEMEGIVASVEERTELRLGHNVV